MIVTDLQSNTNTSLKEPRAKREYSGGFRNYHPPHRSYIQQPNLSEISQKPIEQYLQKLGVQNLPEIYHQIQMQNDHSQQQAHNRQLQSVNRLYLNNYPRKQKQNDSQVQEQNKTQENDKFAVDVWGDDPKYNEQQRIELFKLNKEIKQIHQKLNSLYFDQYKHKQKLLKPPAQFTEVLLAFIISCKDQIINFQKNKSESQYDILIHFRYYLCQGKIKYLIKNCESLSIDIKQLQLMKMKSKYLYCYVRHLQHFLDAQKSYSYKCIVSQACKHENFDYGEYTNEIILQKLFAYEINKFTKPLAVQFKKTANKSNTKKNNNNEEEVQHKIKSKPIPKSTYNPPKVKQRQKNKTTVLKPFNLTQDKEKMTADEYYHWDCSFKGNSIPETTYKPHKINLLTEQEKKAQAHLLLEKSSYPKTMEYLNSFKQIANKNRQEIAQKHTKVRKIEPRHEIPNFNQLHAKELVYLEMTKQQNQKNLEIKPFNLSMPRPKNKEQQINFNGIIELKKSVPKNPNSRYISKSTKKFDAYVEKRKQIDLSRAQAKLQQQEIQKKKMEKQARYKEILKQRMGQQLQMHPMENTQYEPNQSIKVKVNKQKIYREKPLLMESTLPAKQINLPWQPIFQGL